MPISRQKKEEVVARTKENVGNAETAVFVNFRGVTAGEVNHMREDLKSRGVGYMVVKKTLASRALDQLSISGDAPDFGEEFAIAYGTDALAPAQEIYKFQKAFRDRISIVGGIFDGAYVGQEKMRAIAEVPSQKALYGQFVNLINSPIQRFATVIDQIAQKQEA